MVREEQQRTTSKRMNVTFICIVLGLINESRMTYGLRHQDYQRYRYI